MKKLAIIIALALMLGLPGVAFAAKGAQSCGIGPEVIGGKGIVSQVLVQYTNVTLLPSNAVSVTAGTSGCGYSDVVQKDAPRLQYVHFNYDNLAEDAAKGEGVYISGFTRIMGCSEDAGALLTRKVHDQFTDLFIKPADGEKEVFFYTTIKQEISEHPLLSKGCI